MGSYVALVWNQDDAETAQVASSLVSKIAASAPLGRRSVETKGFALFDLSASPAGLPIQTVTKTDGHTVGAVFGHIFQNGGSGKEQAVAKLQGQFGQRVWDTDGRSLISDCWGNYVGFIASNDYFHVIPSPTSMLPCFYMQQMGVTILFSHLERCGFLELSGLSLNFDYVRRLLIYDKIQNGDTGLEGVFEVAAGHGLTISRSGIESHLIWDPRKVAKDSREPSENDASAELREVVQTTISTWAGQFESITVDLSGGLDSSIVVGCLGRGGLGKRISAMHLDAVSKDVSESRYARAAAEHANVELTVIPLAPKQHLPDVEGHPASARPYRHYMEPDNSQLLRNSMGHVPDIWFSGQGGDHLFYAWKSTFGFADYLLLHGVSTSAIGQLLNSARLSRQSIWRVLSATFPKLIRKEHTGQLVDRISELADACQSNAPQPFRAESCFPVWLRSSDGLPPDKFNQVCSLLHLFQIREPFDSERSRRVIHPLISQPVIELCLRFPVYLLTCGGEDRGLARAAFKGIIPELVRTRLTKGSVQNYFVSHLSENRERVTAALVDGELVSAGLIDKRFVQSFFERPEMIKGSDIRTLFLYYVIEAWLRTWKRIIARPRHATVDDLRLHGH